MLIQQNTRIRKLEVTESGRIKKRIKNEKYKLQTLNSEQINYQEDINIQNQQMILKFQFPKLKLRDSRKLSVEQVMIRIFIA